MSETEREGGVVGAGTVREGLGAVPAGVDGVVLPGELGSRYRGVRQFPRSGGEANLFEVVDLECGEPRLLKLYLSGLELKADALERIRELGRDQLAHVVRLFDFGQLSDGRWFEVQELVEGGDLVAFRDAHGGRVGGGVLTDVIAELHAALRAFHAADLAHHDIKPENVLVRSAEPLDLVLGDFGLSVVADHQILYQSNRNATFNYQAPETMAKQGGAARDYWALGLTIAMVATGKQPYAGLNEHAILSQHKDREAAPLVDEIDDRRVRSLCRGLTRYQVANRWGADQVEGWLQGDDPPVSEDQATEAPLQVGPSVSFNEQTYRDRVALAAGLVADWSVAAQYVGVATRRQGFLDQVVLAFGNQALTDLESRWGAKAPGTDRAIAELIVALHPDAVPTCKGRSLFPEDLAVVALDAVNGDADAKAFVKVLQDQAILAAWTTSAQAPQLGEIEQRWRGFLDDYTKAEAAAVSAGATKITDSPAPAMLLAAATEPTYTQTLTNQHEISGTKGLDTQPWYASIGSTSSLETKVLGVLYSGEARRLHGQAVAAEERRAAETAHREAEAHHEAKRRRDILEGERRDRRAELLVPPLMASCVVLALIGVGMATAGSSTSMPGWMSWVYERGTDNWGPFPVRPFARSWLTGPNGRWHSLGLETLSPSLDRAAVVAWALAALSVVLCVTGIVRGMSVRVSGLAAVPGAAGLAASVLYLPWLTFILGPVGLAVLVVWAWWKGYFD